MLAKHDWIASISKLGASLNDTENRNIIIEKDVDGK
jgi:hypothetical protein